LQLYRVIIDIVKIIYFFRKFDSCTMCKEKYLLKEVDSTK